MCALRPPSITIFQCKSKPSSLCRKLKAATLPSSASLVYRNHIKSLHRRIIRVICRWRAKRIYIYYTYIDLYIWFVCCLWACAPANNSISLCNHLKLMLRLTKLEVIFLFPPRNRCGLHSVYTLYVCVSSSSSLVPCGVPQHPTTSAHHRILPTSPI